MSDLNSVYAERNKLVAMSAKMALALGYIAGLATHRGETWDDDWRNVVLIDLPSGQVSWHIHDSELPWFEGLPAYPGEWDGHTTEEKYIRVLSAEFPPAICRMGGHHE